jgi:hypothetical protein
MDSELIDSSFLFKSFVLLAYTREYFNFRLEFVFSVFTMSEMDYEMLYELLNKHKSQISSKYDLMTLFTCWYVTCNSCEYVKDNEIKI